ncbi:MAG TPA: NAD(P)-dependent oxidoreductase [Gemmatimonadales bacterium]|nr:NAD(P)-dependent oxidoreductase [Gemmatimonadales bacterium]
MQVREQAPVLSDQQLERNFADIAPPLTPDYALLEATKCLFCHDAPCTIACPTHIDVPAFIKKIATGNLRGSARVILEVNPFGHSCARACPVEVLCEGACVLNARDEQPIKIALLQRHATDYVLAHKVQLFQPGKPTGKKVAIVGAGPAGLSCARDLRRFGHAVTVFEAKPQPGGLNTYGIAEYKLKNDVARAEVQDILDLGVELKTRVTVGRDVAFEKLLADYDAVFVGFGLGHTKSLGIPGEDLPGVMDALTFIERLKTHPYRETKVGRRVIVIGAGNTAIDAVTQAKRLGAEAATIVYRRGEADMSCYHYEYELAKRDGCGFRFHAVPQRIIASGQGGVAGLEIKTSQGGETIACEMVIIAIGQGERAEVAVPRDNPKVFVGGDCANGGAEIVNAAAEGIAAAKQIHEMLSGRKHG